MPRRKHPQSPSHATGETEDGGITHYVEDDSVSEAQPRKRVRWDGEVESRDEDENQQDSDGSGAVEKVCLAATCQFGRVACAYYDPVKYTVFVFEDTPENQHFDLTKALLEQASPDIVLTSSKADDNFIDVCRDHMEGSGGTFQIRPHKDFVAVRGRDRLLSLRLLSQLPICQEEGDNPYGSEVGSEPRNAYDFMRRRKELGDDPLMQKWNASVRLANYASVESSPLCLGSIGALLEYLVRARAVSDLDEQGIGGLEVGNIEPLPLLAVMQINADALFSLQVFEDENHASIHSDKTKEGLSLFGILNNAKTTLGRALMREWFLRPSMSLSIINGRHNAVECFVRPDNISAATAMHGHLQGTKNIPKVLTALRAGKAKVSDWQGLVKIDWEESMNAGRVCIRPHIDEELDNLKHIYHGIDAVLSKIAIRVSATIPPDYASSLNVVYFPQLGFLVCVPMQDDWHGEEGIKVLDGWTFQFSSDSHVYFKSQEMHDREIEIAQTLQEKVLAYAPDIGRACDICAELDCLLSFSAASLSYEYRRPHMTEENVIDIKQGRHPLQELVVDTFMPNDTFIVGGAGIGVAAEETSSEDDDSQCDAHYLKNSVVVCTGANACGKSVYLKQVRHPFHSEDVMLKLRRSLLYNTWLSFVPAESARLGIVDKSELTPA
ncbi:hypothetical protein BN946_scf184916.g14 [Trametes cinnabarina]|uniref:DNA mismatch repair protein MutS core domain-containing protein n=1 Tax=Pycnoporus cinnabarinus TaxID=5643 RepID=A0A060SM12_PYCCI|nr:hypothetical protein BN946_scf184916.g14 [Trametes cinnabarina]